jgi:biotin carboxyl carrier protein
MPHRALCLVALALTLLVGLPGSAEAASSGGVVPFGGAPAAGSAVSQSDATRILGLVASPTGQGYWQFGVNGAVHAFGDARFAGSAAGLRLNRPIVGMAATSTGGGYWLVASDGGIFSFGDARFAGSTGAMRLNRPVVGMAATSTGGGYWLVASDGGIFTFGDAVFRGSAGGRALPEPVVGMAATAAGLGYRLATLDGQVLVYGDATDAGSMAGQCKAEGVVGLASRPTGGYWLATAGVLPAAIPFGTDPIDTVAAESANMTTLLRLRNGCRPNPSPTAGRFTSPLPSSRISSDYGSRIHPVYNKPQFHSGIDLAGGSKILAPADGVVVQVQDRQGFGLTTIVDHGDGTATVYGHQAAVAVKVGDNVRRGQVIGTVGQSGYATGKHLHFEVRVHGVPTDPKRWL